MDCLVDCFFFRSFRADADKNELNGNERTHKHTTTFHITVFVLTVQHGMEKLINLTDTNFI